MQYYIKTIPEPEPKTPGRIDERDVI